MLKKGDKCHVRLMNGEIVEATYDEALRDKSHWVTLGNGSDALALANPTNDKTCGKPDCRFVCMTGLNKGEEK